MVTVEFKARDNVVIMTFEHLLHSTRFSTRFQNTQVTYELDLNLQTAVTLTLGGQRGLERQLSSTFFW